MFVPTPSNLEDTFNRIQKLPDRVELKERIADMDAERISTLLKSVEGQEELADLLINKRDVLMEANPDIQVDPETIKSQIQLVGATLEDMQEYDNLIQQAENTGAQEVAETAEQEKAGLFRRALGGVKKFAKKHPIITAVLVTGLTAAAVAGGVATGFYLTGNWAALMTKVGLAAQNIGSGVGGAMEVMEPIVESLPGAGAESIPPAAPFGNL